MNDDISPRLTRIRDALVERVEAPSPRRRRPSRGAVIAVVAAFVVGGALSGGLTAAAAAGAGDQPGVESLMATTAKYDVESDGDGKLVGTPTFEVTRGTSSFALGTPPAGADSVAIAFQCIDPGTFSQKLSTGMVQSPQPCGVSTTKEPSTTTPDAQTYPLTSRKAVTLQVSGSGSARYAVWFSWAKSATVAGPSDQQIAEIADDKVTFEEYTAAFNRLEGCMNQAGYPLGNVPLVDGDYSYAYSSEASSVFDTRCYPREFEKVDAIWQTEHPEK